MQNKDIKQQFAKAVEDAKGCGLMQNKDIKQPGQGEPLKWLVVV